MDTFAEIADERRSLAALVSGLTREQQATQSLCSEWSVHDVMAHLIVPLEVGIPKFVLAMLASRGNFDRANVRLTREQARRPFGEITEVLRQKADSRFTPPGSGPEAPLTDVLVHGLDIRWPLELPREIPEERLQTSLTFVTAAPFGSVVPKGALDGLRFEANDIDWASGSGPIVSGSAEALLLAITGRTTALGHLSGDGVPTLRSRLA
ncbi:maleylpyruvate isomerase family mycothiol-dependent enzyme [Geodermatophilus sp. CPCC 206100]|uniref:maleylpyruvate isomerase family mycothiol-dependent enzyme n=1 Tax=Geodermatophilus sp. CPCC 206100 TaxID=3020054 RepID=UPI003B006521